VRPRYEPDASSVVVRDDAALEAAVRDVLMKYEQDALVEEIIDGRDVWAPLVGNDTVESLPLLEPLDGRPDRCPARISDEQSSLVRECAYKAYRALGCRDYARVDVRLTATDEPVVVDVKWADLLRPDGSLSRSAEVAGFAFHELVARIVEAASLRYHLNVSARTVARVHESRPIPRERHLAAETSMETSP
jgi:D-alanine-D-alanine ligase